MSRPGNLPLRCGPSTAQDSIGGGCLLPSASGSMTSLCHRQKMPHCGLEAESWVACLHFWGLGTPQVMLQTGSSLEAPGPLTSGGWSEDAQRQGCQRQAPPSEAGTRRLVARASKRGGKGTAKPLWVGRAGTEASRACPPPSEGASRGQAVGPWRQRGQSEQAAMRVRMWAGSQARSGCASQETGRTGPGVAPCCRGQDAGVGVAGLE